MSDAPRQTTSTAARTRAGVLHRWTIPLLLAMAVVATAVRFGIYARQRSSATVELPTTQVERGTVVHELIVVGRIVPRTQVQVKASVPGILSELTVEPGDPVKEGDVLATIRPVADPVSLSDAHERVRQAQLRRDGVARELERQSGSKPVAAASVLNRARDALRVAELELAAARQGVRRNAERTSRGPRPALTHVLAPIDGTVLATPVAFGSYVSDTNPYRDGTTVAVVAKLDDLLFTGHTDEFYVGDLRLGMPLAVKVGARAQDWFETTLEYIAPQGTVPRRSPPLLGSTPSNLADLPGGVTRFEIYAPVPSHVVGKLRPGYSATAEIVLGRREDVLVVDEGALKFHDGRPHVLVHGPDRRVAEREIQVGISDGIRIEVVSGLELGERVALQLTREK